MKSRLELEIRLGNLLEQTDVDAIVIPTNTDLMLTGELGGALLERGGPDLDAEAHGRGPIALGEATHLQNATLPFRYIILAAVTGMHPQDLVREQQGLAHLLPVEPSGKPPSTRSIRHILWELKVWRCRPSA